MPSTRYETAMKFIGGFETLSPSSLLSCRTPDCTQIFLPSSLALPPKDNAAFEAHLSHLHDYLKTFPVTVKEVMEDAKENKVVVWATSQANFHDEVKDGGLTEEEWAYHGEYVFILTMNENGDRLERIVEFLDSKGTERLWELMKRARGNKEKREAAMHV